MEFLAIAPHWVLPYRHETATVFFHCFPYLASPPLYLAVISLSYWLMSQKRAIVQLGALVCFSGISNFILKAYFQIPRPPIDMHLIPVGGFGFPSGDSQMTTVFFGFLMMHFRQRWFYVLGSFIIVGVMCSRVYLGVHSIYDVTAALFVGCAILAFWRQENVQTRINGWYRGRQASYWGLSIVMITTYLFLRDFVWSNSLLMCAGTLLGYGLSLNAIGRRIDSVPQVISRERVLIALGSLAIFLLLAYKIPVSTQTPTLHYISMVVKYMILGLLIYQGFPYLQDKLLRHLKNGLETKV